MTSNNSLLPKGILYGMAIHGLQGSVCTEKPNGTRTNAHEALEGLHPVCAVYL